VPHDTPASCKYSPHSGSRCKAIADRETSEGEVGAGETFRRSMATSLRISHAIPRPVHRFILSCRLTRPTLSSGSLWPSPPRMLSRRLLFPRPKNQADRCHLMDPQIDARLHLAQRTECSQPGKAVSTTERPYFSGGCPRVRYSLRLDGGGNAFKVLIINMLLEHGRTAVRARRFRPSVGNSFRNASASRLWHSASKTRQWASNWPTAGSLNDAGQNQPL
jgi:hypothetical protein